MEGVKDMRNQITNTGTEVLGQATQTVSNIASNSMNAVSRNVEYIQELGNQYINNFSSVFYAIIALVVICALIGWGLYTLITDNVIFQQRIQVSGTEIPIVCNESSQYSIEHKLEETTANGKRRTYSFWIYINDISKYAGDNYRHIAHIGESRKKIKGSSPYFFLDNRSNKIYVRFAPIDDTIDENKVLNGITSLDSLLKYDGNKLCGFTIDYVPVQRWVHICISTNDSRNGSVYVYIDAEPVKVYEKSGNIDLNIGELKLAGDGQLFVGGDLNDTTNGLTGFSGLISKFVIFNHDLNQNDVYREYNGGPFSGLLTKIGLGAYGIRNPIYKINNANNN